MEDVMTQIDFRHGFAALMEKVWRLRVKVSDGLKWWAEHQAWPAIDEIRIADCTRREKTSSARQSLLRF
jgi:hypothetical protein